MNEWLVFFKVNPTPEAKHTNPLGLSGVPVC